MPRTVLFVEARSEARSVHAAALRAAGLEVMRVSDSQAAREALKNVVPKVLIAGLNPRTRDDQLQLCRDIRGDARTQQITIVLTTEHLLEQDVDLATDPGALVLTATQRDSAKLVAAVQGVLAGQRAEPLRASLRRPNDAQQLA